MTHSMVFAVPGDIRTLTGGYLYDLNLMTALSDLGMNVRHMPWGSSFPHPTGLDVTQALDQLQALPADCAALVDALAYGALDTDGLRCVAAPLFALVHHPLALEPGLDPAVAKEMAARELANLQIAQHIFVTSPHTKTILMDHYGVGTNRVTVVRPGFDQPAAGASVAKADPPLILSVGLLARRKGHDILVRALAQITDLDWRADIVGRDHEPGMTDTLTALIADLGLGDRVSLSGEVTAHALQARYHAASVFALATRYEGYGIVFGEAMGHGLPIVSTRAGAVPETVGPDAGLLVPPEDPAAFADAMRQLISEPKVREGFARGSRAAAGDLARWSEAATLVRDRVIQRH